MTTEIKNVPSIRIANAYSIFMTRDERINLFEELETITAVSRRSTPDSIHELIGSILETNAVLREGAHDPGANWYLTPNEIAAISAGTATDKVKRLMAPEYVMPFSSLTHDYEAENIAIPLPTEDHETNQVLAPDETAAVDPSNGKANRLLQLRNHMLDYGMRVEIWTGKGKLTQERDGSGVPGSPTNFDLFNLVRGQWVLALDGPGGLENPLNYTLLQIGYRDDGEPIRHRVFITKLSCTITGGIPNVWDFTMHMYVLKNENRW